MKRHKATALLIEKIARNMYQNRAPGEMLPLQWSILRSFERSEAGISTVSWIAKHLGLTHAPISRAVSTLVGRDLIAARPDSTDGRKTNLCLTDKGREVLLSDPILVIATLLDRVDESDYAGLSRALEALLIGMERSREA